MSDLTALVEDVLAEDGWPFVIGEEFDRYEIRLGGEHGQWEVLVHVLEETREILVFSVVPVLVPEARRAAMCEAIARANFGLVTGNFEMDMETGDLRFRTSLGLEGGVPSAPLIRHVLHANVAVTDAYLPAIAQVVAGDADPAVAVADAEAAAADARGE